MKNFILSISILLLFVSFVDAQVKTNFNNTEQIGVRGKYSKGFSGKSPFIIPAKDIEVLA